MRLVSVYLITQNRSQLVRRAIESVFMQDYPAIELIVVDDASTDDTSLVISELKRRFDFTYIKNDAVSGACFSRNRAIKAANGYFITGLDDDDYLCPTRVSDLVEAYEDKYAFVCANIKELVSNGQFIERSFGFQSGEFGLDLLLNQNLVGNQVLTTKEKFLEIGGFDENMPAFQDYDTWVRLLRKTPLALKIRNRNYVLDTGHGSDRISTSNTRKVTGMNMFIEKNKDILSKQHRKSMNIIQAKVSGSKYSLSDFFRNTHKYNYKASISLLLSRHLPKLRYLAENFKSSRKITK